jgi:hypothetical protein
MGIERGEEEIKGGGGRKRRRFGFRMWTARFEPRRWRRSGGGCFPGLRRLVRLIVWTSSFPNFDSVLCML